MEQTDFKQREHRLILLLSIVIVIALGLGGYIAYDKFIGEEPKCEDNRDRCRDLTPDPEEAHVGIYYPVFEDGILDEEDPGRLGYIKLNADGTYSNLYNMCEGGYIFGGKYYIDGNKLTLHSASRSRHDGGFPGFTSFFTIEGNSLTFVSTTVDGEPDWLDSFDCNQVDVFSKK